MATSRPAPVSPRLAIIALLLGLTMVALRSRVPDRPPNAPARLPATGGSFPVTALLALAIPALVLATIAALRLRRPAPTPAPRHDRPATRHRRHRWLGAFIMLALLAGTVAATALAARLAGPSTPSPATPSPSPTSVSPEPAPAAADDQVWLLLAATVLLVLLIAVAAAHRPPQRTDDPPTGQPTLARAVEHALSALGEVAEDARSAIIRCYAAMEHALATVPAAAPHAADSASEVLTRAATAGAVRSAGAWRLVELFDEARFSRHPMTGGDRADAETALRLILDELRGHQ